jgi:hypothetical protein
MAKLKGPLYSIDARGVIADAMVFGGWKGIPWVREQFHPQQPRTTLQVNQRTIFTQAVERWHTLSDTIKAEWQTAIEKKGYTMSGFNFFVSEYIDSMRAGKTPSDTPPSYLL